MVCKVYGFHTCCYVKDAGKNVQTDCSVIKFDTFPSSEKVQRSRYPVLAGAYLCPRITMSLISCAHGQKLFDSYIVNRFFSSLNRIFGKIGQYLIIHTANSSMINGNSHKQRYNTFCCGHDMCAVCPLIAVPFCAIDHVSVLQDADLTDIRLLILSLLRKVLLCYNFGSFYKSMLIQSS